MFTHLREISKYVENAQRSQVYIKYSEQNIRFCAAAFPKPSSVVPSYFVRESFTRPQLRKKVHNIDIQKYTSIGNKSKKFNFNCNFSCNF